MKSLVLALFVAGSSAAFATSVIVTNSRGPTATREVVTSTGLLTTGFGAFGVIDESGILGISTTYDGLGFIQYGLGGGAVTTSTSGQFSFTDNINIGQPAGAAFNGKNIYLLVGFGGTNLATSTEMFIYKFGTTFGTEDSGIPITMTLSSSAGQTLLGTEVGNPSTTASGRYNAALITAVPEPSAALLGAIGALGLLRRRRI